MKKKMQVKEALGVAHQCTDFYRAFSRLEEMLQTVAGIDDERRDAVRARDEAKLEMEEQEQRLAEIQVKINSKQAELEQAIENQSTRVEEEKTRVSEPLKKVKEELRKVRYDAQMEKERLSREIHDRAATKAQLDHAIKMLQENLQDRERQQREWDKERAAFSEEQSTMQREIRNLQAQRGALLDTIERLDLKRVEKLKEDVKQERRGAVQV